MPIALLHAYRAANRGDGWLVRLSADLVREATGIEPTVHALDPSGMGDTATAVLPPPLRARAALSAAGSIHPAVHDLIGRTALDLPDPDACDAVIGLGGGYLRSNDPVHELVFRAHHLIQVRTVAAAGDRGAYLPVSVGPFRRGLGRTVRQELARAAWVAVRDDRSARYLGGHARTVRLPDLAACEIGRTRPNLVRGEPGVVGVALRSLRHSETGPGAVTRLIERGHKARIGVQSSSGRTNDDRTYYRQLGLEADAEPFAQVLDEGPRPAVILAGRLHAALAAIAAGFPTIHLGYERKSAGAFADLGLEDYMVDAWQGDADGLADLVASVAEDPEPYWDRLEARFDDLDRARDQLVERVGSLTRRWP